MKIFLDFFPIILFFVVFKAYGIYAATDPDGLVLALLEDRGATTKSVVVIRPATL